MKISEPHTYVLDGTCQSGYNSCSGNRIINESAYTTSNRMKPIEYCKGDWHWNLRTNKTKCMIIRRLQNNETQLNIDVTTIDRLLKYKYLGSTINKKQRLRQFWNWELQGQLSKIQHQTYLGRSTSSIHRYIPYSA